MRFYWTALYLFRIQGSELIIWSLNAYKRIAHQNVEIMIILYNKKHFLINFSQITILSFLLHFSFIPSHGKRSQPNRATNSIKTIRKSLNYNHLKSRRWSRPWRRWKIKQKLTKKTRETKKGRRLKSLKISQKESLTISQITTARQKRISHSWPDPVLWKQIQHDQRIKKVPWNLPLPP